MRHEVFELIDQRERAVWERWPNELDREKAVTDGSNLRTSDPFLVAWDTAFKAAFGDLSTMTEEQLREKFDEIDVDGSGELDEGELFAALSKAMPGREVSMDETPRVRFAVHRAGVREVSSVGLPACNARRSGAAPWRCCPECLPKWFPFCVEYRSPCEGVGAVRSSFDLGRVRPRETWLALRGSSLS